MSENMAEANNGLILLSGPIEVQVEKSVVFCSYNECLSLNIQDTIHKFVGWGVKNIEDYFELLYCQ